MVSATECSERDIWTGIFTVCDYLRNMLSHHEFSDASDNVSFSQVRVMGVVFAHGGKVKLKDIALELNNTPGAVSQSVTHLVDLGLVERRPDENDRRVVYIVLSEKGKELHEIMAFRLSELTRDIFGSIKSDDKKNFLQTITKVTNVVEEKKNELFRN